MIDNPRTGGTESKEFSREHGSGLRGLGILPDYLKSGNLRTTYATRLLRFRRVLLADGMYCYIHSVDDVLICSRPCFDS